MMTVDEAQQLATRWSDRLRSAGLNNPEILSATYNPAYFGNAEAIFRVGLMLLHIVRDRGQELLNVAFDTQPDQFYPIEDIEIAMGWKTLEEINARQEPEQLDLILSRLALRSDQLMDGLSGERERLTRARINRATKDRSQAFINRLRSTE